MKRLAIALGLAVLGLAGSPVVLPLGSAAAYVPTAEEIFAQLAMQAPAVSRAIFETRSVVLAPDLEVSAVCVDGVEAMEAVKLAPPTFW